MKSAERQTLAGSLQFKNYHSSLGIDEKIFVFGIEAQGLGLAAQMPLLCLASALHLVAMFPSLPRM